MRGDVMAKMDLSSGIELLQRRRMILQALLISGALISVATLAGQIAQLNGVISLESEQFSQAEILYALTAIGYLLLLLATYILFGM